MNALTPFAYGEKLVRILEREGDIWFVASDVAKVLEFRDAANAVRCLDEDERGTQIVSTPYGDQEMIIISEPGLYSLIMRSRKPEARKFDRWVRHEVLPSIFKTGSYSLPPAPPQVAIDDCGSDEDDVLDQFGSVAAVAVKLRMISLAKQLHGIGHARRMWASFGLPSELGGSVRMAVDKIVDFLERHRRATKRELRKLLAMTPYEVFNDALEDLERAGRISIHREGPGRGRPSLIVTLLTQ